MKLKLEIQDGTLFLSITDYITPQHIYVLKAGLKRIISEQGKKTVILDFSTMAEAAFQPPSVKQDIEALQSWGDEFGANILIISATPGWGNARTRNECLTILRSPLTRLTTLERSLLDQVKKLELIKAELEAKLQSTGISDDDIKTLRRENSLFRQRVGQLENLVRVRLQARATPFELASNRAKLVNTTQTLLAVLEMDGILPVIR